MGVETRVPGAEALESMAALGREAAAGAVEFAAESTLRGWRGVAAVAEAQRARMRALAEKAGAGDEAAAFDASAGAALDGIGAAVEATVGYTRAAAEENARIIDRALAASTPEEAFDLQIEAGGRLMERMLSQSAALSRIAAETMTGTLKPMAALWPAAAPEGAGEKAAG